MSSPPITFLSHFILLQNILQEIFLDIFRLIAEWLSILTFGQSARGIRRMPQYKKREKVSFVQARWNLLSFLILSRFAQSFASILILIILPLLHHLYAGQSLRFLCSHLYGLHTLEQSRQITYLSNQLSLNLSSFQCCFQ